MVALISLSPWYDVADTLEGVRDKLRLQIGDVDEDRLSACIPAAAAYIDQYLDRCDLLTGPPPPPLVQFCLEHASIWFYNHGGPTAPDVFTGIYGDPLDEVRHLLEPYKQRRGLA
jgi:phage gp36-like protein